MDHLINDNYDSKKVATIEDEVVNELWEATKKFGRFNSTHEGWAVIKEELDELWDEIRAGRGSFYEARKEAKQIAAMAMRYMLDLTPELSEPT